MTDVLSLFQKHMQNDDPTGWFEELYALADGDPDNVPWARLQPNINLTEWQQREQRDGTGKTALVVGCGLGDDAEYIAGMGYTVTAFDISESAIDWCKRRWTDTTVTYIQADLFDIPFTQQFDFVYESYTVQALPPPLHERALLQVAATVGGELLLVCRGRDESEPQGSTPPWALSTGQLATLEQNGLAPAAFEDFFAAGARRFRALYTRL
ncbi:MAG: class I SAM-dependent methyltransferase [Chloroflexota bacterium]